MQSLIQKLQIKAHQHFLVLDAPDTFAASLADMSSLGQLYTQHQQGQVYDCVLLFVRMQSEIAPLVQQVIPCLAVDALCWFCYPKASSKQYQSDIRRDTSWSALGTVHMESVRMVAIDEDWSALRFRHTDFIKVMSRQASHTQANRSK